MNFRKDPPDCSRATRRRHRLMPARTLKFHLSLLDCPEEAPSSKMDTARRALTFLNSCVFILAGAMLHP